VSTALTQNPDLQPSSLEWLGSFPSRWKVEPGLAVLNERQVKNLGMVESTVLSLSYGRVIVKPEEKLRGLVPESFETYQIVEPGNIIIRPTDLQNDQVSLRVGQVKERGIITSAYLCLETRSGLTEDYAHLLLHAYDLKKVFYGLGSGLRQNLSWLDFRRLPIPVPPTDEQAQIVCFIRHLDQRVNRLIKTKRRLIELLNEQKQAIIHRAVTRGLDPTIPLKPSGIEWLGAIPQHWRTVAIKRLLKRMDYGTSESSTDEGVIRVLTMGHIRDGEVNVPVSGGLDVVPNILLLEQNDLLFNRTNSPDLVGKVGIFRGTIDDRVSFASYLVRLRVLDQHSPIWLNYLLGSREFWGFARSQALVSLHQANLNSTRYGQMLVPVPPPNEQLEIAEHLREALTAFELALAKARSEIDFIREYRTRLVADVVTGQLDVRHLDLPEVEESLIEAIDSLDEESDDTDDAVMESDG